MRNRRRPSIWLSAAGSALVATGIWLDTKVATVAGLALLAAYFIGYIRAGWTR